MGTGAQTAPPLPLPLHQLDSRSVRVLLSLGAEPSSPTTPVPSLHSEGSLELVLTHLPEISRIWKGEASSSLDSARKPQVLKPED